MVTKEQFDKLESACRDILVAIGEDPDREGLRDTPKRFARWWREFIDYSSGSTDTTFEAIRVDQMVAVTGMRVYSLCEHHLLPFWCDISVGYLTQDRVLGLSKFARIAHASAHKLQVQERLVRDIAEQVIALVNTEDVAVIASGIHLCMVMRGIATPGTMISSYMGGRFREKPEVRAEFQSILKDIRSA